MWGWIYNALCGFQGFTIWKLLFFHSEGNLWPLTCGYGAKETAHKCVSVEKQKSINSFNPLNNYVVGHNIFLKRQLLYSFSQEMKILPNGFGDIHFVWRFYNLNLLFSPLMNILANYVTNCLYIHSCCERSLIQPNPGSTTYSTTGILAGGQTSY